MLKIDEATDMHIHFLRNAIGDLKIIHINKYICNCKIRYIMIYKLCCETPILSKSKLFAALFYLMIEYNCFEQLCRFIGICFSHNDYDITLLYGE